MTDLLAKIRKLNGLGDHGFAEPFAGGAGASLNLLFLEETKRIHINDADQAIFDMWWALVNRSAKFIDLLMGTPINMAEWRRQLAAYRDTRRPGSRLKRGFAAFYLNRCNRSGIVMNGGPIGGVKQRGRWKLGARFNRESLRQRCQRIAEFRGRITVSGDDGLAMIGRAETTGTMLFIDPPYFKKGPTLYLNSLGEEYHDELAQQLRTSVSMPWVLTYDDCPEIRRLYRGWAAIRPFRMRYSAATRGEGKEVLITPRWMTLPKQQESDAIQW